ncbi:3600_t:CDS:1, partial [Gigaspora rosea]
WPLLLLAVPNFVDDRVTRNYISYISTTQYGPGHFILAAVRVLIKPTIFNKKTEVNNDINNDTTNPLIRTSTSSRMKRDLIITLTLTRQIALDDDNFSDKESNSNLDDLE